MQSDVRVYLQPHESYNTHVAKSTINGRLFCVIDLLYNKNNINSNFTPLSSRNTSTTQHVPLMYTTLVNLI